MSADPIARGLAARLATPTDLRAEHCGIVAGEASAAAQIMDALIDLRARGGGKLSLAAGRTYRVAVSTVPRNLGGSYTHIPYEGYVLIPPADNLHLDFNGATLRPLAGGPTAGVIRLRGGALRTDTVIGPMAVGSRQFQIGAAAAAAYGVGDTVCWRLGDNPVDLPETFNWGFARVTAVDAAAGKVTVDRPLTRSWDGTGQNNKYLLKMEVARDQRVDRVRVIESVSGDWSFAGLATYYAIRPTFPDVYVRKAQIGVGVQYTEGAHFGRVVVEDGLGTGYNTSEGVRIAEATVRIDHLETRNLSAAALSAESACDVSVGYHHDVCIDPFASPDRCVVIAGYQSRVHIECAHYIGAGGIAVCAAHGGSQVTFGALRVEVDSHGINYQPFFLPTPGRDVQSLSLRVDDVEERYQAGTGWWWEQILDLSDGMERFCQGPSGLVAGAEVYLGGGAAAADFSQFLMGHLYTLNDVRPHLPVEANTHISTDVFEPVYIGVGGYTGNNWQQRHNSTAFYVTTPAGSGLTGSGKFVAVRLLIVPDLLATGARRGWQGDAEVRRAFGA